MITAEQKKKLDAIVASTQDGFIKEMVREIYLLDEVGSRSKFDLWAYALDKRDWKMRPALSGVYYDPRGYRVATDGHVILATKDGYDEKYAGKIVRKDGVMVEAKFPNWYDLFVPGVDMSVRTRVEVSSERLVEVEREWKALYKVNRLDLAGFCVGDALLRACDAVRMRKALNHLGKSEVLVNDARHMVAVMCDKGFFGIMPIIDAACIRKF